MYCIALNFSIDGIIKSWCGRVLVVDSVWEPHHERLDTVLIDKEEACKACLFEVVDAVNKLINRE